MKESPPAECGRAPQALVEIGRIVGLHGVRGELRVLPHNPDSNLLQQLPRLHLLAPNGAAEARTVVAARPHKRFVLVRLCGVDSANAAALLVGRAVAVPAADLPAPAPGEYYHADLIGCAVRTETGEEIGVVEEVLTTASNDVCIVRARGREHLIPLVADVVVDVDPSRRAIVIRPLPGLLDP